MEGTCFAGRRLRADRVSLIAITPLPGDAQAQSAPTAPAATAGPSDPQEEAPSDIMVGGYRAALRGALNEKKQADIIVDAVNAEDIADFPDSNLAGSLQRLPGISIDRDNGEGRTISVRGLDGGFCRVRINGMEALSTSGANNADGSPDRSRSFDFNAFASELFRSLKVRKSSSAEVEEGSLGATVDLLTGWPFSGKRKTTLALSAEDFYYTNSRKHNPRIAGLISTKVADGRLGFLFSGAYAERASEDDTYARSPGASEYVYRRSDFTGDELPGDAGFAAPAGTAFRALQRDGSRICPHRSGPDILRRERSQFPPRHALPAAGRRALQSECRPFASSSSLEDHLATGAAARRSPCLQDTTTC